VRRCDPLEDASEASALRPGPRRLVANIPAIAWRAWEEDAAGDNREAALPAFNALC